MATRVTVTKKGDTFTVRSPGLGLRDKDFVFKTAKAAEARKVAEARVAELSEAYFDVERDWEETVFVSPVKRKTACQFQNAARLLGKKNVPGPVEQASLRRGDHALIAARKGNFWVRVTSTEKFKDASGPHASYRGVVIDRKASCEVGTEIAFVDANVAEVFKGKVAKRAPSQKKETRPRSPGGSSGERTVIMLALFLAPIVGLVYLVEQDRKKMGPPPGQNTQTTIGTGMQTKVSGARLPLMRS